MALSEDSRSLLQLLLARGKSYDDIAALLDVDAAEVRRRAHAAVAELASDAPDHAAVLTDYLLGQADPIERAETAVAVADDPGLLDTAQEISDQLRLLVPGADLPKLAATAGSVAPRPDRRAAKSKSPAGPERPRFPGNLTIGQRRLLAILVVGALLIGLVVVLIGTLGGDDNDEEARPASTTAVLRPVAGATGQGTVELGTIGNRTLAASLQFSGLEPTTEGTSYALWFSGSAGSFPVHQAAVTDAGSISGSIAIPEALICLVAGDDFNEMRLSRVANAALNESIRAAAGADGNAASLPRFVGDRVLEGPISMPQDTKDQILRTCNGPNQG